MYYHTQWISGNIEIHQVRQYLQIVPTFKAAIDTYFLITAIQVKSTTAIFQ